MSSRDGIARTPPQMAPRTAIFYAEHPLALLRDFGTVREQAAALRNVERALAGAREDDPLAFQAYRLRQATRVRQPVGVGEGAAQVVAWRRSAARMPALPALPAPPD